MEVYSKYLRDIPEEAEEKRRYMTARAEIIKMDIEIATEASKLKAIHRMGLADAIVLATARNKKVTLITGDSDFKAFKDVEMI